MARCILRADERCTSKAVYVGTSVLNRIYYLVTRKVKVFLCRYHRLRWLEETKRGATHLYPEVHHIRSGR